MICIASLMILLTAGLLFYYGRDAPIGEVSFLALGFFLMSLPLVGSPLSVFLYCPNHIQAFGILSHRVGFFLGQFGILIVTLVVPKGETVLYILRHVQHHVGQLCAILKKRVDISIGWKGRIEL